MPLGQTTEQSTDFANGTGLRQFFLEFGPFYAVAAPVGHAVIDRTAHLASAFEQPLRHSFRHGHGIPGRAKPLQERLLPPMLPVIRRMFVRLLADRQKNLPGLVTGEGDSCSAVAIAYASPSVKCFMSLLNSS